MKAQIGSVPAEAALTQSKGHGPHRPLSCPVDESVHLRHHKLCSWVGRGWCGRGDWPVAAGSCGRERQCCLAVQAAGQSWSSCLQKLAHTQCYKNDFNRCARCQDRTRVHPVRLKEGILFKVLQGLLQGKLCLFRTWHLGQYWQITYKKRVIDTNVSKPYTYPSVSSIGHGSFIRGFCNLWAMSSPFAVTP